MEYKYITGESLPLPSKTVWEEGMLLQDIYPDSSFVSGSKNPQSMRMKPIVKNNFVYVDFNESSNKNVSHTNWILPLDVPSATLNKKKVTLLFTDKK